LPYSVYFDWLRDSGRFQHRWRNVDDVVELGPDAAFVLDPVWPRNDKRIAGATKMRGDLFAPLEPSVHRPRPANREMVVGRRATEFVEMLHDVRGVFCLPVESDHLVEHTGQRSFHRSAIIANLK